MDKSILVVDDEPQILSALRRALRNQSYSVLFANDGYEALEILKQHEVALILSDYMMPGMSGTELLIEAAKIQPNSIRIILSGHSDFQSVMYSIKQGVVHKFLAKPWANDVLIGQLNKALEMGAYPEEKAQEVSASVEEEVPDTHYEIQLTKDNTITQIDPELAQLLEYNEMDLEGADLSLLLTEKSYQQHLSDMDELHGEQVLSARKRIARTQHHSFITIEMSMQFSMDKNIARIRPLQAATAPGKGLDSILDSIQGPYLLVDKYGKIRKFNRQCADLYGQFSAPLVNDSLENFIATCIMQGAFPDLSDMEEGWFSDFSAFDEKTNEHYFKDDIWIKIKATKAPEGAKILLHFDISKKKQMQQSLVKALEEAELAKKEKAALLHQMQEEVAAPMKDQVLDPLEQLKETELNQVQKDYLDNALESGNKIMDHIGSMSQPKEKE